MNVAQQADAGFIDELQRVDPERHARLLRNVRRDSPDQAQALAGLILCQPTAPFRFALYRRPAMLDRALHNGTDEYIAAIRAVASGEVPTFAEVVSAAPVEATEKTRRGGRPKLRLPARDRKERRRRQVREAVRQFQARKAEANQKPPAIANETGELQHAFSRSGLEGQGITEAPQIASNGEMVERAA